MTTMTEEADGTVSLSELVPVPQSSQSLPLISCDTQITAACDSCWELEPRSGLMRLRGDLHKVDMVIAQMSLDHMQNPAFQF